jgi:enamine deaminase RidA (YjgF/YER057c/UK114 family)
LLEALVQKTFVRETWQQKRAFSLEVVIAGLARTIYVAGHTGAKTDHGRSLAGDFDARCRQTFSNIGKTLADAGAKLGDLITMTVFLLVARYTTRMTEIRTEIFGKEFLASAAITVNGFADPSMLTEIQSVAVVP